MMNLPDPYSPEEFKKLLELFERRGTGYVEKRLVATILSLEDHLATAVNELEQLRTDLGH